MTVGSGKPRKGLLAGVVLLGDAMRNGIEPPNELINSVLLAGQVHKIYCGPGKGKSWLALWMAVKLVKRGLRVLYLDKENGFRLMRNRLVALGADPAKVDECLVYVPFPSLNLDLDAVEDYINSLEGFSLVIFDSWINYLAAAGLDENSNGDLARWATIFCGEARKRGIAVLLIDHVGKSGDGSRGASRKLDEVDISWELRTILLFDREQVGMVQLRRDKDREAWLPYRVEFEIGGDPLILRRVDGVEIPEPDSIKHTLSTLEGFGTVGAKYADWMEATKVAGTGQTQFTEARKTLLGDGRVIQSGNTYHAAEFSPATQPDLSDDDLVREPEPDQTGLVAENAQSGVGIGESRSSGVAGLEENLSPQSSPVRTTLGVARAGLVDRGSEETDPIADFVSTIPPELLPPQSDVDGLRERYGPYYAIRTPQELMSTYLRDGYAKPKFRIRDGQRVLVGLVAS